MKYDFLGKTGLKVSKIGFGNWLNSDDKNQIERMINLVQKAWDLGINFFDTAEVYGSGEGEVQMGKAINALIKNGVKREDLVLTTKLYWGPGCKEHERGFNSIGLSRKHVIEGMNSSLKRLELSYVDIVFCHRFDHETPLEETCRAFDWIVRQGLALYWGTSEWSASQIFEAFMICEKYNLIKPVAEQPHYNMLVRDRLEQDYTRLFDLYGYGTTTWSPLAGGFLTGKYNKEIPEQSRFDVFKESPVTLNRLKDFTQNKEKYLRIMQGLSDIAQELGGSQAQLAMAWVISYKNVSTALTSASNPEQLDDTILAINMADKITPEILKRIDTLLENVPVQGANPKAGFAPFPPRR